MMCSPREFAFALHPAPDGVGGDAGPARDGTHGSSNGNGDAHTGGPAARAVPAGEFTDEQLLERYQNGDLASFQRLVERYQRELFHFLIRFLGNRASAEDIFQEAFLQVHQSSHQFDLSRRFRPWLFTIAANKARDLMRSQARRPTNPLQAEISPGDGEGGQFIDLMSADIEGPDEALTRTELQELVQGTVMGMPEHLREILLLSYFHQFPYKQIAEILDIPLGTVKSRLHAAVAMFAERWKSDQQQRQDDMAAALAGRVDPEERRLSGTGRNGRPAAAPSRAVSPGPRRAADAARREAGSSPGRFGAGEPRRATADTARSGGSGGDK